MTDTLFVTRMHTCLFAGRQASHDTILLQTSTPSVKLRAVAATDSYTPRCRWRR